MTRDLFGNTSAKDFIKYGAFSVVATVAEDEANNENETTESWVKQNTFVNSEVSKETAFLKYDGLRQSEIIPRKREKWFNT